MVIDDNNEYVKRGDSALAFKAGVWYVLGNFIGKSITFITTPIFARLMTPSDYGEFSNFASWAVLLSFIVGAELHNTLSRAYYDFKVNYDEYISSITILGFFLTALIYIVFWLVPNFIFKVVMIPKQHVHILFLFLLFSFCRLVYYARERTLYRYKTVAIVTVISLLVPTIISVFAVFFLPVSNSLSARIYGYYLPSALIGVFCAFSLLKKGIHVKWQYCKYALFLSIPLLVHHFSGYLLSSTNVIIAKNLITNEAAAVVSIAGSTTHILSVFFLATSGALTTWLMDNLELGDIITARKGSLLYVILLAVIVIVTILFAPEIIYLLGGNKFISAVSLFPGLAFSIFVQATVSVFTIILTYDKNVVKTATITSVFALLSIVVKVCLTPIYGLMMLVYVNIAVFCVLFLTNYFLVKYAGYAKVVHFKGIVFVVFLTGVLTATSPFIYKSQSIRFGLVGVFTIAGVSLLFSKKSWILNVIRNLKHG